MKSKLYLAYGSNLNLAQMGFRCPDAELIGYTYIEETRLMFRGSSSGAYLSIEPAPAGAHRSVPCGVFRISPDDERRLDAYEGYPRFYKKKTYSGLTLYTMDGEERRAKLTAMAYILPTTAPAGFPSSQYVRTCLAGYADFGFNESYLKEAINDTWEDMK